MCTKLIKMDKMHQNLHNEPKSTKIIKTQSAKMYQMDTVNQNSEYSVGQNAPK